MASNVNVTSNSEISVKNESGDTEINAMALKLKDSYRKKALTAVKQANASPAKVYSNTANRTLTSAIKPITTNTQTNKQEKLIKNYEDVESRKARFAWESIARCYVPYIIRLINGEHLKFISTRMAETHLLCNYLHYLHSDIYSSCTSVKCYFITESEAKILNDINYNYTDCVYGKEMFYAGKDSIARLEDVHAFYTFIEICYKKLLCNIPPDHNTICGFIRINSESVVPYCIQDNQKYVPLFYFEGETENLINQAIKLENWDLSYLKFCCKVQGIKDELYANDSCLVVRLDAIKNYFPPNTNFEEYWPAKVVNIHLLLNQNSAHFSPSGAWLKAPPEIALAKNAIPIIAPTPNIPQSMSVMNTYHNEWPVNQMVYSHNTQTQLPSTTRGFSNTTRNQNMTAQCYNEGSTMSQDNNWMTNISHGVLPPTQLAGRTTPVIGNTVSYPNVPIRQCMTTVYHPMTNSNVVSHLNQNRQLYSQRAINNIQTHQQIQQQQQQNHLITTPQTQQLYSGQHVYSRFSNTQQRNALRNVGPVVITSASEVIDLSTPPSSPIPSTVHETFLRANVGLESTRIPERIWSHHTSNSSAYKILKTSLQGQLIYCINAKPFIYSDLMVTLEDLVQMMFLPCTVAKCAHILNKYLKITLFSGNSEQLEVLRVNRRCRSIYPENTLMAKVGDIARVILQLRSLVSKDDEQIQQLYQYAGVSSKRQRTY